MIHRWFMNLRTGVKLLLAFSAALMIAVVVGLIGLASVERLHLEAQTLLRLTRGPLNALVKVRKDAEVGLRRLSEAEPSPNDEAEARRLAQQISEQARIIIESREFIVTLAASSLDAAKPNVTDDSENDAAQEENVDRVGKISKALGDFETHVLELPGAHIEIADEGDEEAAEPGDEEPADDGSAEDGGAGDGTTGDPASEDGAEDDGGTEDGSAAGEDAAADDGAAAEVAAAEEEKPYVRAEVLSTFRRVLTDVQKLEGELEAIATGAGNRIDLTRKAGSALMTLGAAGGALMALLVGLITTRMVVRPLQEMTSAAHRISEGDLAAQIEYEARDEVGNLAESFRRMQNSLRDMAAEARSVADGDLTHSVRGGGELGESFNRMVLGLNSLLREIHEAGLQVSAASDRILAGLQANAAGSSEEAQAAEQVRKTMEQLSTSARTIASNATDVERIADDASRTASRGTQSVGAALEGMIRVRGQVNEIAGKTRVLGEKCRRIGEVLKIIQDVAGEIHMLALNAAIESASSEGEHGKRFAVVAGEVRRLAERTKQSAEEIRAILLEIQEAADATVGSAEAGAREVEEGAATATAARGSLEEVIGRIHETAQAAREISRATQEQRQASEQVADSMKDISSAVKRMAEGARESSEAVRDLSALADRFGQLTGTFRTG